MALTGQNIIDRVANRCNITIGGGRFDNDDILAVINNIQQEMVIKTKCLKGRRTFETESGDQTFSLSVDDDSDNLDILRVIRMSRDGEKLKMRFEEWMDKNHPKWDEESAETGEPIIWVPVAEGATLYPIADGVYTIQIYFIMNPTDVELATYPFNNVTQLHPYHQLVIPGAAWHIMQEMPETKQSRKNEQAEQYIRGIQAMKVDIMTPEDATNMDMGIPNRVLHGTDGELSVRYT